MTVRLTVYRASWRAQIAQVATSLPGIVPVVKGNGYGFGLADLLTYATEIGGTVAVGSIHELAPVPEGIIPLVLTPALRAPDRADAVPTVGSLDHVARLDGWSGRVAVKLRSSMQRFGCTPTELPGLLAAIADRGLEPYGFMLHLPLAGDDDAHAAEVIGWLPHLPSGSTVSVSHLGASPYERLRQAHPQFSWEIRVGSALWHGKKEALKLTADVLDTHPVRAGDRVGYRHTEVEVDGTLVMIGAGMANAVTPLLDGRSPFHFARRRLALVEPPHMHASMVVVPDGDPVPAVGDEVDVQRPLIATTVDEIVWR